MQVSLKKYAKVPPSVLGLTGRKTIAIVRSSGVFYVQCMLAQLLCLCTHVFCLLLEQDICDRRQHSQYWHKLCIRAEMYMWSVSSETIDAKCTKLSLVNQYEVVECHCAISV